MFGIRKMKRDLNRLRAVVLTEKANYEWRSFKMYGYNGYSVEEHLMELEGKIDGLYDHLNLEYKLQKVAQEKKNEN